MQVAGTSNSFIRIEQATCCTVRAQSLSPAYLGELRADATRPLVRTVILVLSTSLGDLSVCFDAFVSKFTLILKPMVNRSMRSKNTLLALISRVCYAVRKREKCLFA